MHWSEEIAERLIQKNPEKEEFVCAAGISPSGSVHIGNFRDIATPLFVCKALEKKGKKAKLLISWDEFDRCRKIPANVQAVVGDTYDKYIGCPYVDIPDPWGCHENYAKHFEEEFLKGIEPFGIKLFTEGVMVVGLGKVQTQKEEGKQQESVVAENAGKREKPSETVRFLEEKVLTEEHKKKAKKGLKMAGIILGIFVAIDLLSMIIYVWMYGFPQ